MKEESTIKTGTAWLLFAASLPMILFLVIPIFGLLLQGSPSSLLANMVEPAAAQAIGLSMITTIITTAITILAGTPLAYVLARKRFWGRAALDACIDLPIVLPPSVAGIALLIAFGRRGMLGPLLSSVHVEIPFTQIAVVFAQLFVAAPFYIKAAAAGFAGVDRDLEHAAAIDGASRMKIFRTVTLPLSLHSLFGGIIMTWARALGEFGATIIFAGNYPGRTQTMPLAIYIGFEIDLTVALTLALILLVISFAVLAFVKVSLRHRLSVF